MPRTAHQFEEIREYRRNQIMDTALELFAREGFYPTSISRIASKAGISKGLMYNYFSGKDDLIHAIVHKGVDKLLSAFDPDRDGVLTPYEFEYYIDESFRILEENVDYWRLYFAILMQPAVYQLVRETYTELMPRLRKIMEDHFREKGTSNPELEAVLFSALMDGISMSFVLDPCNFPLKKVKDLVIKTYRDKFI
jgi:AcrR family transcriptional regulator